MTLSQAALLGTLGGDPQQAVAHADETIAYWSSMVRIPNPAKRLGQAPIADMLRFPVAKAVLAGAPSQDTCCLKGFSLLRLCC